MNSAMLSLRTVATTLCILPLLCLTFTAQAQRTAVKRPVSSMVRTMHWAPQSLRLSEYETLEALHCQSCDLDPHGDKIPRYGEAVKLNVTNQDVRVRLQNTQFEALSTEERNMLGDLSDLGSTLEVESEVSWQRNQPYAIVSFVPLRKNPGTGQVEKLVSFEYQITPLKKGGKPIFRPKDFALESKMNSGSWYKMAVTEDGVYRVDRSFLESLGIDVANLDPNTLNVYGQGFGILPEANSTWRPDDLPINKIVMQDGNDGSFDANDYFLFWANGPHRWEYNSAVQRYVHKTHLYSDTAFYFIGIGVSGEGPSRMVDQPSTTQPANQNVSTFDDFLYHENNWTNLIKSGREWFGESFDINSSQGFPFNFPNLDLTQDVTMRVDVAAKTLGTTNYSDYDITVNGTPAVTNLPIQGVSTGYTADAARPGSVVTTFTPSNENVTVNLTLNKYDPNSTGWLNYIEVQGRRHLDVGNSSLVRFRDMASVGVGNISEFTLANSLLVQDVWEITDPTNVKRVGSTLNGSNLSFRLATDTLREFAVFTASAYRTPVAKGAVSNQNLHGMDQVDMVVVTHPLFWSEANRLAEHRRAEGLDVFVTTTNEVYNEFSSGMQDITAIKDLMRMLYKRAGNDTTLLPDYLLLVGDGSYDPLSRIGGNTNYIPTYQTPDSWSVLFSYVSDDYFGLLDDNESANSADLVDVGIGRLPVKTQSEAVGVVNKIIHYDQVGPTLDGDGNSLCNTNLNSTTFGDWRNVVVILGDDEDGNIHFNNSESHSNKLRTNHPEYIVDKIYLDAYKQESTPGGERFPDVADALNRRVQKGALVVNYTGHGGEVGWAHERILDVPTIQGWTNYNALPVFLTATCEFSRYDDPGRTAAGEHVLLNDEGGAVALLTTTRLVFSSPNFALNSAFYDHCFSEPNGERLRLGDVNRLTKVASVGSGSNRRNFSLLGDPATKLAYPEHHVVTSTINGTPVGGTPDTISALSTVTVTGFVSDDGGQKITDFNGVIYPTVYDKFSKLTTLGQNSNSYEADFELLRSVIYKGKTEVTNGDFTFTFVVPKDISYQFGAGNIKYYAENGTEDANGFSTDFIVGGSASNVVNDIEGPEIGLFMNDENFVDGGTTDENPTLVAKLFDQNGINTVGNGIGHDLTAILDANTDQAIVLNEYYESDLNTYQSGRITYPFQSLDEGAHSLTVKVWDVYNNSAQSEIDFIVAAEASMALEHVLNYPNPFTTHTDFYFEHNQACDFLDVQVEVFTVAGNLVKTITQTVSTEGFKVDPISWDGRDDFGGRLGRGVYVYRVKVATPEGKKAEKFEKLVILK